MKKKIIIIVLIVALLIDVQRVSAAETSDDVIKHLYPGIGIIYEIDQNTDTVYYTDGANDWFFYGVDDWQIGDTILTVMYDSNTQNTVKDDIIISVKYSAVKIEY